MRLRAHAAVGIGSAIGARVRDFGQQISVIQAPPSSLAEYPALAIMIDDTTMDWSMDEDILVDSDGTYLEPSLEPNDDAELLSSNGATLSHIGTMRCAGRIWVGARHLGKRESIEEKVWFAFMEDRGAPGRILVPLTGATVGDIQVMFGKAAATIENSSWTNEFAFSERLWSWLPFQLDIPILIPRLDPIITSLVLAVTKDIETTVDDPTDLAKLKNLDSVVVTAEGITTYTLAGD